MLQQYCRAIAAHAYFILLHMKPDLKLQALDSVEAK